MATALPDSSIQPVSDSQVQNGAVQSCKCGYTVRKSVLIYETIIVSKEPNNIYIVGTCYLVVFKESLDKKANGVDCFDNI